MNSEKIYNNYHMTKPKKVYDFANANIAYKSTVLDLGCATGNFGEYLHKKRKCTIMGVDFSEKQLEIARQKNAYEKLFCINLNNLTDELDEYKNYFDTIILTDVIEHITETENLFFRIKPLLKENGNIIVSVPNITHQSIKLSILLDEFNYMPCGILDDTHVKFYTARSATELFNKEQLKIVNFSIMANTSLTCDSNIDISKIPQEIIDYVKNTRCALHYQYIFILQPSPNAKEHNDKFMKPILTQKLI